MAITNLQLKLSQLEKTKAKTQSELEEMLASLDQAQIMQHTMEKRAKQFDKVSIHNSILFKIFTPNNVHKQPLLQATFENVSIHSSSDMANMKCSSLQ